MNVARVPRYAWRIAVVGLAAGIVLAVIVSRSGWQTMEVTATAYNSVASQTTAVDPDLAAWGDRLQPGMRAIAVSRDLIDMGLGYRATVRIEGLPGEYRVLDKMARRWRRKIDIYMGEDVAAAREWGRQQVTISWKPAPATRTSRLN